MNLPDVDNEACLPDLVVLSALKALVTSDSSLFLPSGVEPRSAQSSLVGHVWHRTSLDTR